MVCIQYKDPELLAKECTDGYNLGYTGKQAIHPNQIQIIYEKFRPPAEKIEFAKKILEANKKYQAEGKGAFEMNGQMIDMPMVCIVL